VADFTYWNSSGRAGILAEVVLPDPCSLIPLLCIPISSVFGTKMTRSITTLAGTPRHMILAMTEIVGVQSPSLRGAILDVGAVMNVIVRYSQATGC
jgi:hypothetical protein